MVSAGTQRDPGRQSLGVVDLSGWVALRGRETSGECVRLRLHASGSVSENSEVGPKSEEGHFVRQNGCLLSESREVA